MDITKLKLQMLQLRGEWAKAPMTTKMLAGAYMDPLLNLLQSIIHALEATHGNSQE